MCFGCEISDPTVAKVLVTWHSEPPQAVHFWLLPMRPSQEEEQMVVEACGWMTSVFAVEVDSSQNIGLGLFTMIKSDLFE